MHSNVSYLSKLKPHKNIKIKSMLSEFWVSWTWNRICVIDISLHKDFGCTGIEPALQSSAKKLKWSALTIRPRKTNAMLNSGKYADRRSNGIVICHTIMYELQKLKHPLYIYISNSLKYKTILYSNNFFYTQTLVFFAGLSWKKNYLSQADLF